MGQVITANFGSNNRSPETPNFGDTLDLETINQVIDAISAP